jgi:Tfp pilus assembly pilus retraction ATPase PilT
MPMPYDLSDLMQLVYAERAEAVHLHENEGPVLDVKRVLHRIEGPPIGPGETEQLLHTVAPPEEVVELRTNRLTCFYFHFRDVAVFQIMAFREDGSVRLELRRFK